MKTLLFRPDSGTAGGGQAAGQPAGAQNTGDPNPNAGGAQSPPAGGGGQTFTQADIDRIVGERLAREREKYKDYEDLKKKAAEFDKIQEAQKSDLQKAQEAAKKAEEEKQKALAAANERLIKAEVKVVSTQLGIVDPDAAYALMDRSGVKVDDAGNVTGVKEALEALLKVKTYLKGGTATGSVGSPSNPGAGNPPDPVEAAKKLAEERNKRAHQTASGGYDPWATK